MSTNNFMIFFLNVYFNPLFNKIVTLQNEVKHAALKLFKRDSSKKCKF